MRHCFCVFLIFCSATIGGYCMCSPQIIDSYCDYINSYEFNTSDHNLFPKDLQENEDLTDLKIKLFNQDYLTLYPHREAAYSIAYFFLKNQDLYRKTVNGPVFGAHVVLKSYLKKLHSTTSSILNIFDQNPETGRYPLIEALDNAVLDVPEAQESYQQMRSQLLRNVVEKSSKCYSSLLDWIHSIPKARLEFLNDRFYLTDGTESTVALAVFQLMQTAFKDAFKVAGKGTLKGYAITDQLEANTGLNFEKFLMAGIENSAETACSKFLCFLKYCQNYDLTAAVFSANYDKYALVFDVLPVFASQAQ